MLSYSFKSFGTRSSQICEVKSKSCPHVWNLSLNQLKSEDYSSEISLVADCMMCFPPEMENKYFICSCYTKMGDKWKKRPACKCLGKVLDHTVDSLNSTRRMNTILSLDIPSFFVVLMVVDVGPKCPHSCLTGLRSGDCEGLIWFTYFDTHQIIQWPLVCSCMETNASPLTFI